MLSFPSRATRLLSCGTLAIVLTGCGGGGDIVSVPVSVAVSPTSGAVNAGGTQTFTATVTNATNSAVTWVASGGTISGSGSSITWTAPLSGGPFTITATSVQDPTKSASASVTVTATTVSVSPDANVTVAAGGTQTFVATVANTANTAVTWTSSGGTVAASGSSAEWTAPVTGGSFTITATSVADPTKSATVTATVTPVVITLTPASPTIGAGGSQTMTATVTGGVNSAVTWTTTGGTLVPNGSTAQFTAPISGGSFEVRATSVLNPDVTSSTTVTVTPISVTISPTSISLFRGEPTTFTASITGAATGFTNVNFTASCGTAAQTGTTLTYTAPTTGGPCAITATSASDPTKSSSATATVRTELLVTSTNDADDGVCTYAHCSLREAIMAANAAPNTDTILLSPTAVAPAIRQNMSVPGARQFREATTVSGTITLTSALPDITTPLSIFGPGADLLTINADGSTMSPRRALTVSSNVRVTLSGVTITGGRAVGGGGMLVQSGGTLILSNMKVMGNQTTTNQGGGIRAAGGSALRLENVNVEDNQAVGTTGDGGGIAVENSNFTMQGGTLKNNVANGTFGGGLYATGSIVSITQTPITDNRAGLITGSSGGGGVAFWNSGTVTITDVTIRNNTASVGGGVLAGASSTSSSFTVDLTMTNVVVEGNSSNNQGGGVQLTRNLIVRLESVAIRDNHVTGTTPSGLTLAGGILFGSSVTATMNQSTVSGNTLPVGLGDAQDGGGGISMGTENAIGSTTITNSTISGNTSLTFGGGIAAQRANLILVNTTISGNAGKTGGGVHALNATTMRNVTVTKNTATVAGAGIHSGTAANVNVSGVLLSGNLWNATATNCGFGGGTIVSSGFNLSDDATCTTFTGTGDKANTPAGLSPTLANNGGPTFTHALLVGSAAINAGNVTTCTATDQRGTARQGACDIGAYEFVMAAMRTAPDAAVRSTRNTPAYLPAMPPQRVITLPAPSKAPLNVKPDIGLGLENRGTSVMR